MCRGGGTGGTGGTRVYAVMFNMQETWQQDDNSDDEASEQAATLQ